MRKLALVSLCAVAFSCTPASTTCSPDNCGGCCSLDGFCRGASDDACGVNGQACLQCNAGQHCQPGGVCAASSTGGGQGGSGGGDSSSGGGSVSFGGGGVSSAGGGSTAAGGGGGSTSAGGGSTASGGGGTSCGGTVCNGQCVNTTTSHSNCGGCDHFCANDETCENSLCIQTVCTPGQNCQIIDAGIGSCCGGSCIGSATDPLNYGGCNIQCPSGSACDGYKCTTVCTSATCPAGTGCSTNGFNTACYPLSCAGAPNSTACSFGANVAECCDSACTDTNHDPHNCGSCGNACDANQFCDYGNCEAASDCNAGATGLCGINDGGVGLCCAGACVSFDSETDRENCGGCGRHCPLGNICINGECAETDGGYTLGCLSDAGDCASGLGCAAGGALCETVACDNTTKSAPCAGGLGDDMCCGSSCLGLSFDHENCGACGKACAANQFCEYGQCATTPTCGPANSGVVCPGADGGLATCCGSSCTSLQTDSLNCGQCGVECPSGSLCTQGYCQQLDGGYEGCRDPSGPCPAGTVCQGNSCLPFACPPNGTGTVCGFGAGYTNNGVLVELGKCCGGTCVDTAQDPANCGQCGTACTMGSKLCAPSGPFGTFGSQCLPVATNDCIVSCPANTFCAGGFCQQSVCQNFSGGTCEAGTGSVGMCCPQGFSSTCIDIASDSSNCGGCGISCGGGTCANGVCSTTVAPCTAGHSGQFCNLDAGTQFACCPGGGCIDTSSDDKNCGRCGNPCQTGLTCVSSQCIALTCTPSIDYAICAADAGSTGTCCSSACVHESTDLNNCGECGHECVGAETCKQGICGLDTCDPSSLGSECHYNDGPYIEGGLCCAAGCINKATDVNNCGGCNRKCNTGQTCVSGNCQ